MLELRFNAMGCECHVVLLGGREEDLAYARSLVYHLDSLWSRFQDNSELSRLNRSGSQGMAVSYETLMLIARGVRAQRFTDGWFDPFMGRDIARMGYDRDFAMLTAPGSRTYTATISPNGRVRRRAPASEVAIDLATRTVCLPDGFDFDSGGIGKGLAADVVTRMLLERGVSGALVNLGGDLRCRGVGPEGGWIITLDDPLIQGRSLDEFVRVLDGAVATSTPLKRRWVDADGRTQNHLLHPSTGLAVNIDIASITVIAPSGWIAEAISKALLVGGPAVGVPLLHRFRAAAIAVDLDGSTTKFA